MKSEIISFGTVFTLACALAVPAAAQQLTPFKVGISDAVNTVLPLWMAEAGGFYAAQGLKVEIINMGGGSNGAQELQAGQHRPDARRPVFGGAGQPLGRRPAADRVDEQRDPLRGRHRARREDARPTSKAA